MKVRPVYRKNCARCGQVFERRANSQIYCSMSCRKKDAHERARDRKMGWVGMMDIHLLAIVFSWLGIVVIFALTGSVIACAAAVIVAGLQLQEWEWVL